tara:strand:- start:648 stop:1475 length:828 start_codon:yes stop_codon:yes gene_type:complete
MGFLSKIFGKKPKVPEFVPVDYDKEYDAAMDYNEENIERFGGISRKAQEQDQQALTQGLRSAIPNYDELLASEFDITSSLLRGELSKREQDRLRDRRAALGLSTGTQDSDLTQYSYARDLGLAERDLINQGMAYADNRIRRQSAFVAQPVSVTSMFQSPQQRIAQKMSERDSKFNRDFAANKIAAAPDPRWVGMTKVAMAAVGGMAGGMAGASMGASLGSSITGSGGGGSNLLGNLAFMQAMGGGGFGFGNQSGYSISNGRVSRASLSGMADDNL